MKTLQYFSESYLEQCKEMSSLQIVSFLENFRIMSLANSTKISTKEKLKPISIKMPEDLLLRIKLRAKQFNIPYQTLIKDLLYKAF